MPKDSSTRIAGSFYRCPRAILYGTFARSRHQRLSAFVPQFCGMVFLLTIRTKIACGLLFREFFAPQKFSLIDCRFSLRCEPAFSPAKKLDTFFAGEKLGLLTIRTKSACGFRIRVFGENSVLNLSALQQVARELIRHSRNLKISAMPNF